MARGTHRLRDPRGRPGAPEPLPNLAFERGSGRRLKATPAWRLKAARLGERLVGCSSQAAASFRCLSSRTPVARQGARQPLRGQSPVRAESVGPKGTCEQDFGSASRVRTLLSHPVSGPLAAVTRARSCFGQSSLASTNGQVATGGASPPGPREPSSRPGGRTVRQLVRAARGGARRPWLVPDGLVDGRAHRLSPLVGSRERPLRRLVEDGRGRRCFAVGRARRPQTGPDPKQLSGRKVVERTSKFHRRGRRGPGEGGLADFWGARRKRFGSVEAAFERWRVFGTAVRNVTAKSYWPRVSGCWSPR